MNYYIFPFDLIPQCSDIVLYGAGNVGMNFYNQIFNTNYANIVAWIDKKWEIISQKGYPVEDIANISDKKYDYIVIAIDDVRTAANVRRELVEVYGVQEKKIIHSTNYRYNTEIPIKRNIYNSSIVDEKELAVINPKKLLSKCRLDLPVRYLVAKDFVNGTANSYNNSLYARMILCRTNAYEPEDYYSEYSRNGINEYLSAFEKTCISVKNCGFKKEKYIPLGKNGIFLNGAHRIAASLATCENIWVKGGFEEDGAVNYGFEWFENNGFNNEDKIRILRAFADLYADCGLMVLYGTCEEQWNYLEAQIKKNMSIVGSVVLDFSNNYIAFENIIHEIYSDPLWRNVYIDRKLDLLMMSSLKMKVILTSDENFKNTNLYNVMTKVKLELRDRLFFDTDIAPIVMHGSDSKEEFEHLKHILLSVNNLNHLYKRTTRNYSEQFVHCIDRFKNRIKEDGISQYDVFCAGSASYEIFGLRRSNDLDVVFHSKHRGKYGDETIWDWMENIDYTRKDSIQVSEDKLYEDDVIISDDNLYYMFNGMKFVNIDIIAQKKAFSTRDKDKRDVHLFGLFKNYVAYFDDKAALKRQIENNFYKKR